ncbi:unnamed protein product, partial [Phaeothamnion confervicola]
MNDFRTRAAKLRDFPDKAMIDYLTKAADANRDEALRVAALLEGQVSDPAFPAKYKLPLVYLIDSILKNVREPYTTILAAGVVGWYSCAWDSVDSKGRASLIKVLGTWEAGRLFAPDKLQQLREIVASRSQGPPQQQPPPQARQPPPHQPQPHYPPAPVASFMPAAPAPSPVPPSMVPPPAGPGVSGSYHQQPPQQYVQQHPILGGASLAAPPLSVLPLPPAVSLPPASDYEARVGQRLQVVLEEELRALGESATMDELWQLMPDAMRAYREIAAGQVQEEMAAAAAAGGGAIAAPAPPPPPPQPPQQHQQLLLQMQQQLPPSPLLPPQQPPPHQPMISMLPLTLSPQAPRGAL